MILSVTQTAGTVVNGSTGTSDWSAGESGLPDAVESNDDTYAQNSVNSTMVSKHLEC